MAYVRKVGELVLPRISCYVICRTNYRFFPHISLISDVVPIYCSGIATALLPKYAQVKYL
jgi:hypothetical protein